MNYDILAEKIYRIVGPTTNIRHAGNCMTRLRLQLNKVTPEMTASLKAIEGIIGIHTADTELQIILGPGAAEKTASALKALLQRERSAENHESCGIGDGEKLHARIRARNATPFKLLLKKISHIFIPLIPGFIACGLIMGLLNLLLKAEPSLGSMAWVKMLSVMGNGIFYGMNLFVGFNAAREFGGSPVLGGILAAIITHPALKDIMLGDEFLMPGRGGIIAVLLVTSFGAWLELRLRKIIPSMLDLLLTPLLTILIAGFAALFILQPVGGMIASAIGNGVTIAIHEGGALTGFLLGGLWLPIVMLGIHQAMTPIHVQLIQEYGVTLLLPILAMAGCGQIGACVAVYFKTRNQFLKKTILSALPVGIMGIGEPLIYGVTLPLGRPFITACIGGAFGGAVQAAFSVGSSAIGISGLPLTTVTNQPFIYLAGILTSYIAGFAITWVAGFDDPEETLKDSTGEKTL